MTYRIETNTPKDHRAAALGDRFVVLNEDGTRQASGRLYLGEVTVMSGTIPDDATRAKLEALANPKPPAKRAEAKRSNG